MMELVRTGVIHDLMASGATVRTAFCGPCFGAGDVPANGALSIRHTTRNFPSREGSKPGNGQLSGVALMDARSIAATTANGGILTPATDIDYDPTVPEYQYDPSSYDTRVYQGFGKGDYDALLKLGPNIKDWPEIAPLGDNLLLKVASYITDPVTTTDELIPSGETSSYRSNPLGLAEFTLSRKDPEYVGRAKAVQAEEKARRAGEGSAEVLAQLHKVPGCENLTWSDVQIASTIFAVKPGDGSAVSRRPAASVCWGPCQHRYRVRHQALPLQPHQLGYAAAAAGGRNALRSGRLCLYPECPRGPQGRPAGHQGLCAGRHRKGVQPVHGPADRRRAQDPGRRLPDQFL